MDGGGLYEGGRELRICQVNVISYNSTLKPGSHSGLAPWGSTGLWSQDVGHVFRFPNPRILVVAKCEPEPIWVENGRDAYGFTKFATYPIKIWGWICPIVLSLLHQNLASVMIGKCKWCHLHSFAGNGFRMASSRACMWSCGHIVPG